MYISSAPVVQPKLMKIAVEARDEHVNCLLLNNLDGVDKQRFLDDWLRSRVKICADGALDLLKTISLEFGIEMTTLFPDYLIGDFDSVNKKLAEDYKKKGGQVIDMPSQDTTDFEKCIKVYGEEVMPVEGEWLLVFGSMGGRRLDHTLAAFQPLLKHPEIRLKLIQGPACAFLVPTGKHELTIEDALEKTKCGLFPIGSPCKVSTSGLKWNIDDQVLSYGTLISVSNEAVASTVNIKADNPLIFTIQPN